MAAEELHVGDAFPPQGREAWEQAVSTGPRAISLERLRRRADDPALWLEPVYFPEDAPRAERGGWPGVPPFVRGVHPLGAGERGWRVVARPTALDAARAAGQLGEALDAGAEEVWLPVGTDRGVRVATLGDVAAVLEPVDLGAVPVQFEPGPDAFGIMAAVAELAAHRGVPLTSLRGGWGFDPIGTLLGEGELLGGLRGHWQRLREAARWSAEHAPAMTIVLADEAPVAEAGAGGVLGLGVVLAEGVEYLRRLLEAGLPVAQAAPKVRFSLVVGQDFFVEVARLRAARWCWAKIVAAFGGPEEVRRMRLHARGALHHRSRWDAWDNLLRVTGETMAAALGGAEAVTALPHAEALGSSDARARRLARNVHWLLREEAHLARVADPAAGSWYLESLTERLARQAWQELQRIEAAGGVAAAVRRGLVQRRVEAQRKVQEERLARRELVVVGVSEFADPAERAPADPPAVDLEAEVGRPFGSGDPRRRMDLLRRVAVAAFTASERAAESEAADEPPDVVDAARAAAAGGVDLYVLREALAAGLPHLYVRPLPTWRRAAPWEALREEAERYARIRGEPPVAWILPLGPVTEHRAALDWTRGLLGAGGFAVRPWPAEAEELPGELLQRSVFVLVGSPERLAEEGPGWLRDVRARGCGALAVAGRPDRDAREALEAAGARWFLRAGTDLLEALQQMQRALGVRR